MESLPLIELFRHTYNTEVDRNIIGDIHLTNKNETDSNYFCYSLEDEKRADGVKVYGKTAISDGKYKFKVTMSNRFKRLMILLIDVPDFSGVRIHGGNTSKDSHGCPLVAYKTNYVKIWSTAEKELTQWAIDNGGEGYIIIKDAFITYDRENKKIKDEYL